MKRTHALAERIRRGDPLPAPLAAFLSALTPLTRAGMAWRMRQPRVRVDARVISFGNITAGGTGKTPAAIERARREIEAGRRVAVLTRGYGSRTRGTVVAQASDAGEGLADRIGDEPALILRKVPEVTVVKTPDRIEGARAAIACGCDTLILDDGFQYVRLERDEDIVVVDAGNPFGNGRLIPRGILREPVEALSRATAFVVTRSDRATDLEGLLACLAERAPEAPVRTTRHAPATLWRVCDGEPVGLETLDGRDIVAACAIGSPETFFATLEGLGARLAARHAYPDHARFPIEPLGQDLPVVVTEKDAVRLAHPPPQVLALGVEIEDWPKAPGGPCHARWA